MHLNHSPPATDAESFKHKGGMGQLLSALQSKLTQSSRSKTAVGTEAGVAEDRGLLAQGGRWTARTTRSKGDTASKEVGQGSEDSTKAEARGLEASPKRGKGSEPHAAVATIPYPPGGS